MSRTTWEYRAYGSGPGHLQRIASNSVFTRAQRAYRAYIDHGKGCVSCRFEDERCPTADGLWEAYREANT